jgi:hypothetical protein
VPEDHAEPSTYAAGAANALLAELQDKLKRTTADADRHAAEKAEVLRMADAASRERDELSVRVDSLAKERDRLLAEAESLKKELVQATARGDEALAEAARLAKELASQNPTDSLEVIWGVVRKETKAGVAFLRSKIPEGHPGLKWFDLAVEWSLAFGCFAVESTIAFVKWATPVAKDLSAKGMAVLERMLSKK